MSSLSTPLPTSDINILARIALCIERGKASSATAHPRDMMGQDGADELVRRALQDGIPAAKVLSEGLMAGMKVVGERFRAKVIFVPEVLMATKAMHAGMAHLRPHFESAGLKHRGTFVIGTVRGDLHDIGKKLVAMMVTGAGWDVVDLGVDIDPEIFIETVAEQPGCAVGLSALLTTTMESMRRTVAAIKSHSPHTRVIIGGAPVTQTFAEEIGADAYGADPPSAVDYLERLLTGNPS